MTRAVALIDGEHYPSVVRDALARLPYEWAGAILVGGTEKLVDDADWGVPLLGDFGDADLVVDLSDEPVLAPDERFQWISRALAAGLPFIGADFRFEPPLLEPFGLPSVGVIGTGKRVGKTSVTTHLARLLAPERDLVVVAMGRGGPPEPELIDTPPTVEDLIALAQTGRHAASDHLEIAALAGVPTIGCWRAGGGLAGGVVVSNVRDGARLAESLQPSLVLFDGSGAAIPPIEVDRRVLVTARGHDIEAFLNLYRRLVSDLVIAIGCDVPGALRADLRIRATAPLEGRVAIFAAGPAEFDHLDADVVHFSRNLADRPALREELAHLQADTYLVEIKAAAIDVVAEHALAQGAKVVFAGNQLVGDGVDEALLALAEDVT
jgi:cyclic 2,3-diphosphoglycerate synthetase